MPILEAAVLGVLQGITEFWPISSSAHLALLPKILHWESPLLNSLAFDVALHAGTLAAVMMYFWEDLKDMIFSWFKKKDDLDRRENRRLSRRVVLATIPAVIAALFLEKYAEETFRSPGSVAWALVVGGVLMGMLDWLRRQGEELHRMRNHQAFLIGAFQALALIPGVSRSGASLTALRFFRFKRPDAARFSFLLSIPIIAGAVLYEGRKILGHLNAGDWPVLVVGVVSAFVTGYFTIRVFMRFLRSHSLVVFAVYRIGLGASVLAWAWFS